MYFIRWSANRNKIDSHKEQSQTFSVTSMFIKNISSLLQTDRMYFLVLPLLPYCHEKYAPNTYRCTTRNTTAFQTQMRSFSIDANTLATRVRLKI